MDTYTVVFVIFREDGVCIEHKYAHLPKEDVKTQTMAIYSQINELVDDEFNADFLVRVIKEEIEEVSKSA